MGSVPWAAQVGEWTHMDPKEETHRESVIRRAVWGREQSWSSAL